MDRKRLILTKITSLCLTKRLILNWFKITTSVSLSVKNQCGKLDLCQSFRGENFNRILTNVFTFAARMNQRAESIPPKSHATEDVSKLAIVCSIESTLSSLTHLISQ